MKDSGRMRMLWEGECLEWESQQDCFIQSPSDEEVVAALVPYSYTTQIVRASISHDLGMLFLTSRASPQ